MLDKFVFKQSRCFYFFSSACFFDIISSISLQVFGKVLVALILGGTSKIVFSKRYTLSQVSFQLKHPLRMQALSRFWLL